MMAKCTYIYHDMYVKNCPACMTHRAGETNEIPTFWKRIKLVFQHLFGSRK